MKQEGLLHFTDSYLLWIGFFLFFLVFLALAYRTFCSGRQSFYLQMSSAPLDEESANER